MRERKASTTGHLCQNSAYPLPSPSPTTVLLIFILFFKYIFPSSIRVLFSIDYSEQVLVFSSTTMTLRAGYEPLLEAIRDADIPSLERLLSTNQYSVNTEIGYQSEDGKPYIITPLYWAVKVDQPSVCRFLLHKKADPYRHMVYEYYPLHEACSRGNKDIVQEFIWAGCNLDQPNCDGDTPLHIASMRGHVECIKLLLNAGANHKARNSKGETPLEAGRYTNQTDLHKLFEVFEKG